MAHSRLGSLWAYSAFICVCLCASLRGGKKRRKKNKRGDTHTMLSPMWHGTRTLLEPTSHAVDFVDFGALKKQPQAKQKMWVYTAQKKKEDREKKLPSWMQTYVWHWQALCVCAARAQDQQRRRRNHPVCRQTAAVEPVTRRRAAAVTLKCTKP